ncbi:hypothetical protein ACFQ1E_07520 [Sphingomonas canadensis]|uniref:Uncharacterized protein n=1 Tax=Sphingomonas canadensis TaxID=1219257 RepID=A0ABW3HA61_9SPHN|nr:hypothetical protein [Sphingomonas canadensis]MCW3835884.1 hypothetical protein [Sphingomonas canadensis]
MIRFAVPAALLMALAAPSATSQTPGGAASEALDKALTGLKPGKEQSCIPRFGVNSVKTYDKTMLYMRSKSVVWRNDTSGSCGRRNSDDILIYRSPSSQYCRGDIVETRSRATGTFTGTCTLGAFVPYKK